MARAPRQADGFGIDAIARLFTDFGYVARGELLFPAKSLRALWFAPPPVPAAQQPLPRVFISELKVGRYLRPDPIPYTVDLRSCTFSGRPAPGSSFPSSSCPVSCGLEFRTLGF